MNSMIIRFVESGSLLVEDCEENISQNGKETRSDSASKDPDRSAARFRTQ